MIDRGRPRDWLFVAAVLIGVWALISPTFPAGGSRGYDPSTLARDERLAELERSHTVIPFQLLASFPYVSMYTAEVRQSATRPPIPARVRDLSGRRVAIDGFMLPLDIGSDGINQFLLNASYDMCQFGAPVVLNQQVEVTMTEGRRTAFTHLPLRVYGVLDVGEVFEDGKLRSLYRLQAEAVGPPRFGHY
jgi:hypothetical protein